MCEFDDNPLYEDQSKYFSGTFLRFQMMSRNKTY